MSGKQHESRLNQEPARKSQISDESQPKYVQNSLYDSRNNIFSCFNTQKMLFPDGKDDDFVKTGIHYYTLSIMNESNKVCLLFYILFSIFIIIRYALKVSRDRL